MLDKFLYQMETAKPIDWKPKWDGGAPMPHVFANGNKVYLIYTVAEWDRQEAGNLKTINTVQRSIERLALVEFKGHTFKFGVANDEVFQGLPLYKKGLTEWAHVIENSTWIEELKSIHKVHPYYNPFRWTQVNHYVLLFKDQILEVIATGYQIELFDTSYYDLSNEVIQRMNRT